MTKAATQSKRIPQKKLMKMAADGYVELGHPTVALKIGSDLVDVDEEIVELIKLMNSIPGIKTKDSCQDCSGVGGMYGGYVQFAHADSTPLIFQQLMMGYMKDAWYKHLKNEAVGDFIFSVELGNEFLMMWSPSTYPAVLKAARMTKKEIKRLRA